MLNILKNKKILSILIVTMVIIVIITLVVVMPKNSKKETNNDNTSDRNEEVVETKNVQIVNLDDKRRPYAVMINNHSEARPQSGLKDAYIVYEFMVEGGITRMLALYTQDKDIEKIGSVRSARHYYLDYVMENDAIYVHWGGSDYAYNDISSLGINDVDGMVYGYSNFVTDSSLNRSLEHTRFTSSNLIKDAINNIGYRNERNADYLLNYTTDEVDLSKLEDNMIANNINVTYSDYITNNYSYNADEKVYYRSINYNPQIDLVTGEQYKFKNIIIYALDYSSLNGSILQNIANIGMGRGYYITNGYAIPINWNKSDRGSQTVYTYLNGKEIDVSDGNTFIEVYPTSGNVSIN